MTTLFIGIIFVGCGKGNKNDSVTEEKLNQYKKILKHMYQV